MTVVGKQIWWEHNRARLIASLLLALATLLVVWSFWRERYTPWVAALTLVFAVAAVRIGAWWPTHRRVALTIGIDVLLIFAYLWTLDERLHVVIQASATGYVATVGDDVLKAPISTAPGRIALIAGDAFSYRVQTTGEASYPSTPSLIGQVGQAIRFAAPKPAWTNVQVRKAGTPTSLGSPSYALSGQFSRNVRGEWESAGGVAAFAPALRPPYTITADLMRPDGTQGLLVGLDSRGRALYLQIRMDRPDISWLQSLNGQQGAGISGEPVRPGVYAMAQRTLRLLLGNVIAALLLCGAAALFFVVASTLLARLRLAEEVNTLEDWLQSRGVVATLVAITATAAFVTTALIADKLLGRIPHVQDDVAYVFQAKTMALGRLWTPVPHVASFFKQDFINMYHGHWFGKYAPGWPVILAVGELIRAGWLINPALAAIDVVLIYLIGREVYGRTIGLIACLLTLSSPFFLFLSGSYMAHTSTLAYLAGFALLLLRWVKRADQESEGRTHWSLAVSGFLLGMAFITRQLDAIAFAAPFALLSFSRGIRARMLPALLWLALGGAIPILCLLGYNWDVAGNPLTSPYAIWSPFDRLGFGPTTLYNHTPGLGLNNTSQNLQMLLTDLFGWPYYLTLALALVPFIVGRPNRWDVIFGLSALTVMGAYIFYWGTGIMFGPRYYFAAIPWLTLLSARGLEELYRLPTRIPRLRGDRAVAALFCLLLSCGLLLHDLTFYLPNNVPIYSGYNFVSADPLQTVQRAGIHHALVFTVSNPSWAWWSYGAVFSSNSPLLDGDIIYARDQGGADSRAMRLFPGRSYYRLDGTALSKLGP